MYILIVIHTFIHTCTYKQRQTHTYIVHGCMYMYVCACVCLYVEFLIRFEAWDKLAQQWLVCAPLGIHLEPINKELMLLEIIKRELCSAK